MNPAINIQQVVRENLCCSCGTCVRVCPQGAISMSETYGGLLFARVNENMCNECGLCLMVCPGHHLQKGLIAENRDPLKGEVLAAFCGVSTNFEYLRRGQSGGIATAILCHLLSKGIIRKALVTQMPSDGSLRPVCKLAESQAEILKAQGSKYFPVPLNSFLPDDKEWNGAPFAIVGLPCHFHGLRNMLEITKSADRPLLIGVICDRIMSYWALDYLISKAGLTSEEVESFRYKDKSLGGWPGDISVKPRDQNVRRVSNSHRHWCKKFFTPARCYLCFDKMNYFGDIVLGDAWGVGAREKKNGCSVVLARTQRGYEIVQKARESNIIDVEKIDPESVFAGQYVERKRRDWTIFTTLWKRAGNRPPDFGIGQMWHTNIRGDRYRSHSQLLRKAVRLANMPSREDVLKVARQEYILGLIKRRFLNIINRFSKYSQYMKYRNKLLIGGGGFANKGAEAMVLTLVNALRAYRVDPSLILVPVKEPYVAVARNHGLRPLIRHESPSIVSRLRSKLQHLLAYISCRVILDVGGYQFGDPWGAQSAKKSLSKLKLRNGLHVPTYLLPQAWGPFTDSIFQKLIPQIIRSSAMAFVRDAVSLRHVKELDDASAAACRFSHDIAWAFRGEELSWGKSYLGKKIGSLAGGTLLICITPNLRVYEKYSCPDNENPYLNYLIDVTRGLVKNGQSSIIFMGHELRVSGDKQRDDRYLCRYLSEKVKSQNVHCIDDCLSAGQVKSILGCSDIVISSRYHALIAALSQCIPSIALGWSHKYEELMASVGLADNSIRVEEGIQVGLQRVRNVIRDREHIRSTLRRHVPGLKQSAEATLRCVLDDVFWR
jgi:coenzyme F420 hydrogenase subunit beta